MKHLLYILSAFALLAACNDDIDVESRLDNNQEALLGRAVNFNASIADEFTARASYDNSGAFNHDDMLVIYRQYSNDGGTTFDEENTAYRVYHYKAVYAGNTNILLNTEWVVNPGKIGSDGKNAGTRAQFVQTEADSLTWDNGKTVRFRAWGLSNLAGALSANSWSSFYPDFTMADWVSSSGPSQSIPLSLRHLGCRMGFTPYPGNKIHSVEICLDAADYKRIDNSDSMIHDQEESERSDEDAQAMADAVRAAYERLCMPGGIDLTQRRLKAMSVAYYNSKHVSEIEREESQAMMISFDELTGAEIKTQAQRPVFTQNDVNFYSISIPYDMSTDNPIKGEILTIPPYTRFRIRISDVNNGDGAQTGGFEGSYHIFALDDLDNPLFEQGLHLYSGYSYIFQVGYHYGKFSVDVLPTFSWTEQDATASDFTDTSSSLTSETDYDWWTNAIEDAIYRSMALHEEYSPKFEISSERDFLSFIKLVNGTADSHTGTLVSQYRSITNPDNGLNYWWYDPDNLRNAEGDTIWVSHAEAKEKGYIFYKRYIPGEGDRAAYVTESYLEGAFSFYSDIVNRAFTVTLTQDIDFGDCEIPVVGTAENRFKGKFSGYYGGEIHALKNFSVASGYVFDYTNGSVISNLVIESYHKAGIVKDGYKTSIIGVAVNAPSPGGAIASRIYGTAASPCYIIGCIHTSDSSIDTPGALVDIGDYFKMWGCMNTTADISGGALLRAYENKSNPFLAQQSNPLKLVWGNCMCNYYDTEKSPSATAVGGYADAYAYNEYVRGARSHVLCAKTDNIISAAEYDRISDPQQRAEFYGIAPWKAMNCAIHEYNTTTFGKSNPCRVHYEQNTTGYNRRYPVLKVGVPDASQYSDVLK